MNEPKPDETFHAENGNPSGSPTTPHPSRGLFARAADALKRTSSRIPNPPKTETSPATEPHPTPAEPRPEAKTLNPNDDFSFQLFTSPHSKQHVLTCPQGIMAYKITEQDDPISLLRHHLHPDAVDQKLREILAANPNTKFTPELQAALGITVIDFQPTPAKPPEPTAKPATPGIRISFDDQK